MKSFVSIKSRLRIHFKQVCLLPEHQWNHPSSSSSAWSMDFGDPFNSNYSEINI